MDYIEREAPEKPKIPHYYGDTVRKLFIVGGILMLVTLPIFYEDIPIPFIVSVFAILVVALLAGLTNPRQAWVSVLDLIVSVLAFIMLEYVAIFAGAYDGVSQSGFFLTTQALAIIFFIAVYYSAKTLRGMYRRDAASQTSEQ